MAGLWIEYHVSLRDFWKIKRLGEKLAVPYAYALGLVSCLWTWTASNKHDGNLSKFSDAEIAGAARWEGMVNGFVGYLKECELMDQDGRLHDWDDHGTRVLRQARERKDKWKSEHPPKKARKR